jgi:peptidoglycan/xylan/chitin deacetylase (PgdA/CDA1 family)
VKDTVAIEVVLDAPSALTVTIAGEAGAEVAELAASLPEAAGTVSLRWDGRDARGRRVPDGRYVVHVVATAADGSQAAASAGVLIDTARPAVAWLRLHSEPGAGPLHASYRVADAAKTVSLALVISRRTGSSWIADRHAQTTGSHDEEWRLRRPNGAALQPGAYRVALRATDAAGNTRVSAKRSILVDYPVVAHVVRRLGGAGGRVALTFDDCNDGAAWTSILRTLEARHLQASFFCLGSQVARHAAQARRALRDGDTIGNHTWTHPFLPARTYDQVRSEVARTTRAWWQLAHEAPLPYFRPPYGALSQTALSAIGSEGYSTVVLWDVDPQDWRRPGVAAIVDRATRPARSGSIVLLHVLPQTATALPAVIARLHAKGLRPVSLDALLAGR